MREMYLWGYAGSGAESQTPGYAEAKQLPKLETKAGPT